MNYASVFTENCCKCSSCWKRFKQVDSMTVWQRGPRAVFMVWNLWNEDVLAHLKILQDQLKSPPVEFSCKQSFYLHSVFRCSVAPKHTGHCWGLTGWTHFLSQRKKQQKNICKVDFLNWGNAVFLFEPPVDGIVWSHRQDCFFYHNYWWRAPITNQYQ